MYAVIKSGGKQYRVSQGDRLEVERLGPDAPAGAETVLAAVMLVDGDRVLATPEELTGVTVRARVIGEAKGPKITGFTYKSKTNQRRRWGHRQKYSTVEITEISSGGGKSRPAAAQATGEEE